MDLHQRRWPVARAQEWHESLDWQCGFNYLPRNAVNFIAMWHRDLFAADLISEELQWAHSCGYNSLRTNVPFALWETDQAGLFERIDRFLSIADKMGITVTLCPLDDCEFSGEPAHTRIQPPPIAGLHNSRAIASPGRDVVMDESRHPKVAAYVTNLLDEFSQDPRVILWDLYNEPGNRMIFRDYGEEIYDEALEGRAESLLATVFTAARDAAPTQPLTVGAWHMPAPWESTSAPYYQHTLDQKALEWSDIVSFHAYRESPIMRAVIAQLSALDRPMICSEWMARHVGSTLPEQLPLLREHQIHSYHWGLVQGLTQTHLPWPEVRRRRGTDDRWFHDVLHNDGTPYDPEDIAVIRRCRGGGA